MTLLPPVEISATDETFTVVNEHWEVQSMSNHSLPNQTGTEANKGKIEDDSNCNAQEPDKDPSPQELNHLLHLCRKYYPIFSEPQLHLFEQTLHNAPNKLKTDQK